ncbi:Prostaglandin E2 receptor EP2 subtype [Oryzias melastigma]|uniref:Prostaglandin E2 receptor EP2 subtype n=1 Tax=Oryzias melastigma TaxID=30732 RepID=A0A834C167_ORYME|nr:Prostaglandin E2 receptor EP2 subtype [Oryzias melastigma]
MEPRLLTVSQVHAAPRASPGYTPEGAAALLGTRTGSGRLAARFATRIQRHGHNGARVIKEQTHYKTMMIRDQNDTCHNKLHIDPSHTPVPSAIMFAAGIFGNVLALMILELRRRREAKKELQKGSALFHILITALVVT